MKKILIAIFAVVCIAANSQNTVKSSLTLAEVVNKIKANSKSQILDARTAEEFAQNHLVGAINIDLKNPDYLSLVEKLDKTQPTYTYSIGGGRSGQLARQLREKGFTDVLEIPGGLANWVGSGYAIVNNTKKGVSISLENYKQLSSSEQLVLVDIGSKYCPGCRRLTPVLDSLDNAKVSNLKVLRIEAYDSPDLGKQLDIKAWPTLILYKNGKEVWKNTGYVKYTSLQNIIETKGLLATK